MVHVRPPGSHGADAPAPFKLEADKRQRIADAVDWGFEAELAYLSDIVRIPSTRGQEARVQDFIHDDLARRGYDMDRWRVRAEDLAGHPGVSPAATPLDQAWCVVGTHRSSTTNGRSLILNAHIDVVPAGPLSMWTSPPFEPSIRDGWMYGRGAGDMKSGVAINVFAMEAIRAAGYAPAATVHLETVPEEESTGNGALSSLVRGYRADAWLCTEPTAETLVRGNCGVVWFKISVIGTPAHTSEMQAGFNAIDAIYRLVSALRKLEADWNRSENRHPVLAGFDHPLNLNLAQIRGGDWTSMVPAWCEAELRFAMSPGKSAAWVRDQVEACVAAAASADPTLRAHPPKVEWHGFFCEGYELARGSAAEATLSACHRETTGRPLADGALNAYLDARVPALYGGMPALVYGARGEKAHGFDERVEIQSIRRCTKTVALFIAEWCGLHDLGG